MLVMTQCVVRALLTHEDRDPVRFLDTLNRALYGNVQRMGSDKNLTLSLIDYADGEMRISGQHESMIVVRRAGESELVDSIVTTIEYHQPMPKSARTVGDDMGLAD